MSSAVRQTSLFLVNLPLRLALVAVAVFLAHSIWQVEVSADILGKVILATVTLRFLIYLQCGMRETIGDRQDSKALLNNLKSEIKYILGMIAAIYLLGESISRSLALTFFALNLILQNLPPILSLMIRHSGGYRLRNENLKSSAISGSGKTALIYGSGDKGKRIVDMLTTGPDTGVVPVGFIDPQRTGLWSFRDVPLIGGLAEMRQAILTRQVDLLFMAAEEEDLPTTQKVFSLAESMGVPICVLPEIYQTDVSSCELRTFSGQPALVYSCNNDEKASQVFKLVLDRFASALGLVLIAPIMLAAALAVKLTSSGPVFFRQVRLGKNGAPFTVYKFRTMCVNAEDLKESLQEKNEMSGPMFKIKSDPRITAVGRFMRKYSIDELPQLFNVFKGDMSLVGPRPALPDEVSRFSTWQRRKLAVKPGVTCVWQVSGRNNVDFEDWMKLDMEYIDNWSLWLDTKILARTVPTVLKGSGS